MKRSFALHIYVQAFRLYLLLKKTAYIWWFKFRQSMLFYRLSLWIVAPFSWRYRLAQLEVDEKYEDVIRIASKRLETDVVNTSFLHEALARNFRNLNQIDQAWYHLQEARKTGGVRPSLLYEEGLIYFLRRNYTLARQSLETALQQGHDTAPLQIHLGKVYYQLGLMDNAEHCFRKVLTLYPREGSVHFLLGMTLKNKGQYHEARDAFLSAIEYGSDHKEEHLGLAEIYTRQGQWDKAILEYQHIIHYDPDNFVSHYFLGLIYEMKGYENEAIQEYITANKINPEDEETKRRLTRLLASSPT